MSPLLLLTIGAAPTFARPAAAGAARSAGDDRLDGRVREAVRLAGEGRIEAFRAARIAPPPADGMVVSIEVTDAPAVLAALDAGGIEVLGAAGDRVQAFVPWERLHEVAGIDGVRRVREPWRADAKARVTEGYAAIMERDWQADGFDGAGVKVAIVDVGFAQYEAAGEEVPAGPIVDYSRGRVESTAHGTAVTEIAYDFAPGATWYLATISTEVDLAEVLEWLADEHVDVVNASVGFDNRAHADGQSYVTRAVEAFVDSGGIYVAAAGNENDKYRVGALARGAGGVVTLAGAAETAAWASGGYAEVSLRWSEPFGDAATDLDLVLYNEDGSECGRSADPQDGDDDPFEIVYASGCSELVYAVVVAGTDAVDPLGLEGYLYDPRAIEEADWTNTEDLTLPGDTRGGISVGAWSGLAVPDYSSRGPTNDGRNKPDVVAPTAVSTATYGPGQFEGSSAAAPHVAGLAALWVDASNRRGQPEVFRQWLRAHATDVGLAGTDAETGAGLAHADTLPSTRCGCGVGAAGTWPLLGFALSLLAWRRR